MSRTRIVRTCISILAAGTALVACGHAGQSKSKAPTPAAASISAQWGGVVEAPPFAVSATLPTLIVEAPPFAEPAPAALIAEPPPLAQPWSPPARG